MRFTKLHGAGNDYIYIDARSQKRDWPEVARQVSDRHFGIGSDGLNPAARIRKSRRQNADVQRRRLRGSNVW